MAQKGEISEVCVCVRVCERKQLHGYLLFRAHGRRDAAQVDGRLEIQGDSLVRGQLAAVGTETVHHQAKLAPLPGEHHLRRK